MKQITNITTANLSKVQSAVNKTLDILGGGYTVGAWKLEAKNLIIDGDKGMTIYSEKGDVFATPDWALDWYDGEWSGVSANGQHFTICNCEPKVESE